LSMTKRLLDNAAHSTLAQSVEAEGLAQNINFPTADVAEAAAAFVEKRDTRFRGN
jgi:enoyl-CoA hydratase/carnithine racemase